MGGEEVGFWLLRHGAGVLPSASLERGGAADGGNITGGWKRAGRPSPRLKVAQQLKRSKKEWKCEHRMVWHRLLEEGPG